MYKIDFRKDVHLFDASWWGVFTPDDMHQYAQDCKAGFVTNNFSAGYRGRVVISDSLVLAQDALLRMNEEFASFPPAVAAAMVTRSAIMRMQIKRAIMEPFKAFNVCIFDDADAALEWLLTN